MKTTTEPVDNAVQFMRQIRDEISNEIKDMTFEEERAFLDKLLRAGRKKERLVEKSIGVHKS